MALGGRGSAHSCSLVSSCLRSDCLGKTWMGAIWTPASLRMLRMRLPLAYPQCRPTDGPRRHQPPTWLSTLFYREPAPPRREASSSISALPASTGGHCCALLATSRHGRHGHCTCDLHSCQHGWPLMGTLGTLLPPLSPAPGGKSFTPEQLGPDSPHKPWDRHPGLSNSTQGSARSLPGPGT